MHYPNNGVIIRHWYQRDNNGTFTNFILYGIISRTGGVYGMAVKTVGIDEASQILGLSKEALRKRINRGSIDAKKDKDGRWLVTVNDTGTDRVKDTAGTDNLLLEHLQRENERLWQELSRKDAIIMNLTESVKLLGPGRQDKQTFFQRLFNRGGNDDNV
jgi:hypothetical protein